MALGEYTSVTTANEQIDSEVRVERRAFRRHPQAERAELVAMLVDMGMTPETATKATDEIHRDETRAVNFHLVQELGVDPREKPSPWVAAGSSFVMFALGAIMPLIPYLLGFGSLWAGLACGGVGLLIAGGAGGAVHPQGRRGWASLRQLAFGGVAIGAPPTSSAPSSTCDPARNAPVSVVRCPRVDRSSRGRSNSVEAVRLTRSIDARQDEPRVVEQHDRAQQHGTGAHPERQVRVDLLAEHPGQPRAPPPRRRTARSCRPPTPHPRRPARPS